MEGSLAPSLVSFHAAIISHDLGLTNLAPLRSGLGEFYFETARAISSITANRTIIKFPNLHWRVSHGAGAFPDISDRFLLGFPKDAEEARRIYTTRFWYDSAGPVYPRQIKGLLAHDVPVSQMVFGTVSWFNHVLLCLSLG
jgi:hypothetical protein